MYSVQFNYHDNKKVFINLEDDELDYFFSMTKEKEPIWINSENKSCFYPNYDALRYVELIHVDNKKDNSLKDGIDTTDIDKENSKIVSVMDTHFEEEKKV